MKKLVLASTLLSVALLQGCIISSGDDDDDDIGGEGAAVTFVVSCPIGATTFTVTGLVEQETEDCAVGEMTILVDAGSYDAVITATGEGGEPFPGLTEEIDVVDGDSITVEVVLEAGQLEVTWTIDDFAPDQPTCDDLDAGGVSALATVASSTEAVDNVFDCAAGEGLTNPMYLDDYVVVVALLDNADLSIADSAPIEVSLTTDGQIEDLGNINFVTDL